MTVTVNIDEAKTQLSRLLERVQAGERVVIAKAGKPIAEIVELRGEPIRFGTATGRLVYDDDHFDNPDPDILRMFYGPDAVVDA